MDTTRRSQPKAMITPCSLPTMEMQPQECPRLRVRHSPTTVKIFIARIDLSAGVAYFYPPSSPPRPSHPRLIRFKEALAAWFAPFKPAFHEVLPIDVVALHGAIVCGNPSTPSLLVVRFSAAEGSYGVVAVSETAMFTSGLSTHETPSPHRGHSQDLRTTNTRR